MSSQSERQASTAGRRALWALAYAVSVTCGAVLVIGPSALAWRSGFIAWEAPYPSAVPVGDHLYNTYALWLWQHGLLAGHLPWLDPFQFSAGGPSSLQPFGWPLAIIFVPVSLIAGPVAAYNTLVFFGFIAAAGATGLLVRELGASRPAAAAAGFAFAFAPFRLVQAATHFNALLAWMLPLLLFCLERALTCADDRKARRAAWGAVAVGVSIVGSGELHLAVFSGLLWSGYTLARLPNVTRTRLCQLVLPAAVLALGTAVVAGTMYMAVLAPSVAGAGRSTNEAAHFAPRLADLARRELVWDRFERYAYPGIVITVAALAGAVALFLRRHQRSLSVSLLVGVGVVWGLAITPSLVDYPTIQKAYRLVPFLSFSRVPGRILIVSALFLAMLTAFAVDVLRGRQRLAAAIMIMAAILIDTPSGVFHFAAAGDGLPAQIPRHATVLDLPPFDHGHFSGSGYTFEITRTPAVRVGGYSPFVTPAARERQQSTVRLMDLPVDRCAWAETVERLGVDHVVIHLDLFGNHRLQWDGSGSELAAALVKHAGFVEKGADDHTIVLVLDEAPHCDDR